MSMNWNIRDLVNNINTGIEYEYALYYCLLQSNDKHSFKMNVINNHPEKQKIEQIISSTDISGIMKELQKLNLKIDNCTIETQNDAVGPSDILMNVVDISTGHKGTIGISVKYQNSCTLNVTGKSFLNSIDIKELKQLQVDYSKRFIDAMNSEYGNAIEWFRKRKPCDITDQFIDLIRDRVINNWSTLNDKKALVKRLFQMDSPIKYWIYEFKQNGTHVLNVNPPKINLSKVDEVKIEKYETSYVSFYLDGRMIGKMQVKFNNGFLEKCKKSHPDFIVDGIKMALGAPFSSWNFSVIY